MFAAGEVVPIGCPIVPEDAEHEGPSVKPAPDARVLIVDPLHSNALEVLRERFEVQVHLSPPPEEFLHLVANADVLVMRSSIELDAEAIERAKRLKLVARAGIGFDNIDLVAAKKSGIQVFNVPSASTNAVAEFTLTLILAISRKVVLAHKCVRDGSWNKPAFLGRELRGSTLGLIGLGKIGSRVAELAVAFDMNVKAVVENPDDHRRAELSVKGVELTSLDALLAESHIVCLLVPSTTHTRDLIAAREFRLMRPEAVLINVARAAVIDEDDLYDALRNRSIAGAGLDFVSSSKLQARLHEFDNVVVTPHIGAMTVAAQKQIGQIVAESIDASLDGRPIKNRLC